MNEAAPAPVLSPAAQWARWVERYTWHLDQVPVLLEHMHAAVVPLQAFQYDRPRVQTSMDGSPLPFRVDTVDEASLLWDVFAEYAVNVDDVIGAPWRGAPGVVRRERGVSGAFMRVAAFQVTGWLAEVLPAVANHPELQDSEDFLFGRIRSARARFVKAPMVRRVRPRLCGTCGQWAVTVVWVNDEAGRARQVAACSHCGASYEG